MKASIKLREIKTEKIVLMIEEAALSGKVSPYVERHVEQILTDDLVINPYYRKAIIIGLIVVFLNVTMLLNTSYHIGSGVYKDRREYKTFLRQLSSDERPFWINKTEVYYFDFIPDWVDYLFVGFYLIGGLSILINEQAFRIIEIPEY